MDRRSCSPLRIGSISWRVTPKPMTYFEGQSPSMPKACLPQINPRKFSVSHDTYDTYDSYVWDSNCLRNINRTKSNSQCREEAEIESVPVSRPNEIRPEFITGIQALEKGREENIDTLSRFWRWISFLDAEGEFFQGIKRIQKLVSVQQSQFAGTKLFNSCFKTDTRLKNYESETHDQIQPTPPESFCPQKTTYACEAEEDASFVPQGCYESRRSKEQLCCLRVETNSQRYTNVESEGSPLPYTHLPPMTPEDVVRGRKTLVVNLNGTLVYPSLETTDHYDFQIPAWVNQRLCEVFVVKRPGLAQFLATVARMYEVVVFSASSRQYTDLILDIIDEKTKCIRHRVYQDACTLTEGGWVKDLSVLGRDLTKVITVDTKPNTYRLQPANALLVRKFHGDKTDTELDDLLSELELVWRLNV